MHALLVLAVGLTALSSPATGRSLKDGGVGLAVSFPHSINSGFTSSGASTATSTVAFSTGGTTISTGSVLATGFGDVRDATSSAVSTAVTKVAGGTSATAAADAAATAIAQAVAEAFVSSFASTSVDNGFGLASTSGISSSLSTAVADAVASSLSAAQNGISQAEASSAAGAISSGLASALAEAQSKIGAKSGGAATAQIRVVVSVIARPIAQALTSALSVVEGSTSVSASTSVAGSEVSTLTTNTGSGGVIVSGPAFATTAARGVAFGAQFAPGPRVGAALSGQNVIPGTVAASTTIVATPTGAVGTLFAGGDVNVANIGRGRRRGRKGGKKQG
ncbi:hypothetical protein BSKO_05474 [Bryopsis sp. KO-2023]|nr:hypothetical protein BSKO_05474 [Bryopsis sp. KO-2023]